MFIKAGYLLLSTQIIELEWGHTWTFHMPKKSPFFCRKLKFLSKKHFSFMFEGSILLPYISLYNTGCLIIK